MVLNGYFRKKKILDNRILIFQTLNDRPFDIKYDCDDRPKPFEL